jgi:hypothetical protein
MRRTQFRRMLSRSLTVSIARTSKAGTELQPISVAGGGMKHAGKLFVPGLTPQIVWTYRGAEAQIQISERKPTFLIKEPAVANIAGRTERDLVIVRFDRKKDHRQLRYFQSGTQQRPDATNHHEGNLRRRFHRDGKSGLAVRRISPDVRSDGN